MHRRPSAKSSAATVQPPTSAVSAPTVTVSASDSALPTAPPALPRSDSGRTIARADNRAGSWKAKQGAADDRGPLHITVTRVGGGSLAVTYRSASSRGASFFPPCDGDTPTVQDEALPPGPVNLTITPDGNQRWSVDINRGAKEN